MPFIERIREYGIPAVKGNANYMRSSRERNERTNHGNSREGERKGGRESASFRVVCVCPSQNICRFAADPV